MLAGIDWAALDGQQVEIQSSLNWLTLRTKAGQVLTFGQAMKPLVPRGKAAAVEPPAERNQELEASNGTGLVEEPAGQESGRGPGAPAPSGEGVAVTAPSSAPGGRQKGRNSTRDE